MNLRPIKIRQFLALAAGLFSLTQPVLARAEAVWRPTPDDAVLFDVRVGTYRLGDGVRGYQTPDGTCLDLADTIMALDLPIRLDKKLRRATGWAFDEQHTILIDREANAVQIMNKREKIAEGAVYDAPEGWCVDAKRLSTWLGVTLNADLGNALLFVRSDTKLPVELAAERRARAAKVRPSVSFDLKSLPQANAPFRGVKAPSIDALVSIGGLRQTGVQSRLDVRYELFATGEVGPVAYDARLASNNQGVPETLRVRAYRTDPDGKLLGPLMATQVAVGDVAGFTTSLVAQSSVGRGAMITNRPVDRPDSFDRTNFRGELPAGWDAELYRNGQLLALAANRDDGRYEFRDVALLYGQNRFEVVLYGPQGQVRREERNVPVGQDSIPPRQTWYWAGVNQDGRDLIGLGRAQVGTNSLATGGWRGSIGLERGLNTKTSVAASVHSLTFLDSAREVGRRNFFEAAVRRSVGPALVEVSATVDTRGRSAFRAEILGELKGTFLSLESIQAFDGFRSDRILAGVTGFHRISVDHSLKLGRSFIPVHAEARYTKRANGNDSFVLNTRASTNFGRYTVTGELDWTKEKRVFGPDPPDVIDATLRANARIGRVRFRGETKFRLSPQSRFESAALVGEWSGKGTDRYVADWRAEIGYDKILKRARFGAGYARRFEKFAVTATAEAATDGAVAAGLNLSFSLGPDPRRGGGIRLSSSHLAAQGQVLARVFRDENGDGVRQASEPIEKDVQIAAGRVPVDRLTDTNGEVIVEGLQPFMPVLIGVDASSIADPLVQPATPGIVVTPRPGIPVTIDLPLVGAGEVDGTLVKSGGGNLEGVDLELVDASGRIVSRARSDFDGFFLFESVPYGQYGIRISQLSADAARLATGLTGNVRIDGAAPSFHFGTVAADPSSRRTAAGGSLTP
jgi:hypothetical protein